MKNKFIRSTLILIIGGFITKIFSLFIKIILTRNLGLKGISNYMLIMPTFNLFIVLSQLGFNVSISKLVAEGKNKSKNIIVAALYISFFVSILLMIILLCLSKYISVLLHNKELYYPILSISLTLPFISISCIIRSYFFGKEKMIPHVVSNIFEQIIRIILFIFLLPTIKGSVNKIIFVVLSNIISELTSILILYFYIPKNISIKPIKPDIKIIKEVLNISLPTTSSKLIGTVFYFFEPIILTYFLLKNGYSLNYIIYEYGIITGYVFPLLLMPSFFSVAVSQSTIPVVSKAINSNNKKYIKNKIKQSLLFSLLIGLFFTIIFLLFKKQILKLVFNTNLGLNYLYICTPLFLIFYLEAPINSILQSINKSKDAMITTLYGSIIKTIIMIILCYLKFGMYSLIISTLINIYYVTIVNYIKIKSSLS